MSEVQAEAAEVTEQAPTQEQGSPLKISITLEGRAGGDFKVTATQKVADLEERTETHEHSGIESVFDAIDDARAYLDGVDASLAVGLLKKLGTPTDQILVALVGAALGVRS